MWNTILNPINGKNYSVNSKMGKIILRNYIKQLGGASSSSNTCEGFKKEKCLQTNHCQWVKSTIPRKWGKCVVKVVPGVAPVIRHRVTPVREKKQKDRKDLCVLPPNFEYIRLLGNIGKDGETWLIRNNANNIYYACKIFRKTKNIKSIKTEIQTQQKLSGTGIAPEILEIDGWHNERCFIMDLVYGHSLVDHKRKGYSWSIKDIEQIQNIARQLAKKEIMISDSNFKMNLMYDTLKDKWFLIDYGMINKPQKKLAELNKKRIRENREPMKLEDYLYIYHINEFIFYVESKFIEPALQKAGEYKYTPLRHGYIPNDPEYPSFISGLFCNYTLQDIEDVKSIWLSVFLKRGKQFGPFLQKQNRTYMLGMNDDGVHLQDVEETKPAPKQK